MRTFRLRKRWLATVSVVLILFGAVYVFFGLNPTVEDARRMDRTRTGKKTRTKSGSRRLTVTRGTSDKATRPDATPAA
jgi:hypothetical protein